MLIPAIPTIPLFRYSSVPLFVRHDLSRYSSAMNGYRHPAGGARVFLIVAVDTHRIGLSIAHAL